MAEKNIGSGITAANPERSRITQRISPDLVERAKKGDAPAVDELIELSSAKVGDYLNKRRGIPPSDKSDIVQETLIGVLKGLNNHKQQEGVTFEAWLFGIASKKAADFFRKQQKNDSLTQQSPSPHTPERTSDIAPKNIDISTLTSQQRQVVAARMRGLTLDDIARRLGVSKSAVWQRLSRAKKNIPNNSTHRKEKVRPVVQVKPVAGGEDDRGLDEESYTTTKDFRIRSSVSVEDIGVYLSGMAILAERQYLDSPNDETKAAMEKIKNREEAYKRATMDGRAGADQFIIRTIFAPEIEEIANLREQTGQAL